MDADRKAQRERSIANGQWFRELLERAEDLPPEQRRPAGASNGEWLLQLAENGKAELEARKHHEA